MINHDDFEQFFNILMQFGKLMSQQMEETRAEKTATMLQFMVLQLLQEHPQQTVSDMARALKLSKSSATQLIERLVKADLVTRIDDVGDRRIVRLSITTAGKAEFKALKYKFMAKMATIFSHVPAQDLRELIRIYTALLATMQKAQ